MDHGLTQDWPIFVISLADATARRRTIRAQLDALALPFEIIDAVDGRKELTAEHERMIDREGTLRQFRRPMTNGEYACALSHMSVYRRIVDQGLPGAIVLEDDALLSPLFPLFLAQRGYLLASLVQMDHMYAGIWRFARQIKLTPGITLARWSRNSCLATGYSISASGAAYLLAHGLPIRAPADWPCDLLDIRPMLTLPQIVRQPLGDLGHSSLEAERLQMGVPAKGKKRAGRFLERTYWRRWLAKRTTIMVS